MKYVFLGSFAVLAALSVVAGLWHPRQTDDRIELVWCTDDNPVRRGQIALFNELYPRYRLRIDPQNSGMQKVIVQSLAGVGPDLFDCYTGSQLVAYVRSGIAMDCTEALAERGIDIDAVWPCLKPLFVYEGRAYGHPDNANAYDIWYNKVLFDEAGEPYPSGDWTWDEFIEVAQRLTVRDERGRPVQFGFIGYWDYNAALAQWGADYYTPEGTRCVLDSPEAVAAIQFMQDLIYRYEVMPTPTEEMAMSSAGGWGTGVLGLFGAEKGAMALGGRWWLCLLRDEDYAHMRLGAVPLPHGPSRRQFGGGRATLVNATGQHIEGALTFMEYLHSKEWSQLVNRQADALGPVMKYHYGEYEDAFLHNPEHPEEDCNAEWRTALEDSVPLQVSSYVNGQTVERIMLVQLDLVKANLKPAAEAMRDAAEKINKAIVETLRIDPVLRDEYERAVAAGARPAWDDEEGAP